MPAKFRAMAGFADFVDVVHGADPSRGIDAGLYGSWHLEPLRQTPHRFVPELSPRGAMGIRSIVDDSSIASSGTRHEYVATRKRSQAAPVSFIWHQYDAVEALRQIEGIAVFFFRRDRPEDGEGSSGIRWLDSILLERVLAKLESGGLLVTDGAGMTGDAPQAALWTAGALSDPIGSEFTAFGRRFRCESVFCSERRPTLVWRIE
jgi:hypothetical protein